MNKLFKFISSYIEDIFIFTGLLILILTAYMKSIEFGNIFLGTVLIIMGLLISRKPPKY